MIPTDTKLFRLDDKAKKCKDHLGKGRACMRLAPLANSHYRAKAFSCMHLESALPTKRGTKHTSTGHIRRPKWTDVT